MDMWPFFKRVFPGVRLPRRMLIDMLMLPLSLWLALACRYETIWPRQLENYWWLFFAAPAVGLPLFAGLGMYRTVPVYASLKAFYNIALASSLHALLLFAIAVTAVFLAIAQEISFSVFAIYWFVSLTFVGGSRVLLRSILASSNRKKHSPENVVIYGAGSAGAELAQTLQAGREYLPVALVDDKQELHGREIRGLRVYPTGKLETLIKSYNARQVLLAIPSAQRSRRNAIVNSLAKLPVHVQTVPALADIVCGRAKLQELREIDIEDILERATVPPDQRLLSACITGKAVMVTGAGGSIGTELCRQIVKMRPLVIVLFEASEYALYNIDRELRDFCACGDDINDVEIVPILGTVTSQSKLKRVLNSFSIRTVYHAAAYKHVPLVEQNPIEGVKNNIFGTWHTAKAILEAGVDTFVLISTDKAVRPKNVMGATKRMAELVIQALARESAASRLSIVRFGNVLGSSGSVVPLFREQIQNGGPITLTHPEMTRYFMTIPEAAQLVVQAGAMAQGGDVFVLDMGEPVSILSLARRMIALCGLTVRDEDNPDGDIAIQTTRPRPGEKLCEELVLGDNLTGTEHSRILRANEVELPLEKVECILNQLEDACSSYNVSAVRKILKDVIEGYAPECEIQDLVWIAARRLKTAHTGVVNY